MLLNRIGGVAYKKILNTNVKLYLRTSKEENVKKRDFYIANSAENQLILISIYWYIIIIPSLLIIYYLTWMFF